MPWAIFLEALSIIITVALFEGFNYFTGKSWTRPEKTDLPNNNAAIQANVLSSGKVVLCFNPTTKPRDIMRIAVSEDGGETWPHYKVC